MDERDNTQQQIDALRAILREFVSPVIVARRKTGAEYMKQFKIFELVDSTQGTFVLKEPEELLTAFTTLEDAEKEVSRERYQLIERPLVILPVYTLQACEGCGTISAKPMRKAIEYGETVYYCPDCVASNRFPQDDYDFRWEDSR